MRIGESNNIRDITPILGSVFIRNIQQPDSVMADYIDNYNTKRLALGSLAKYFNNQMSDYEVMAINKENDIIKIVINDLNYSLMAEDFVRENKPDFDLSETKFPFSFLFHGIKHFTINDVDETGEFKEIPDYSIVSNTQILFDQLIYFDNNTIEIGFSLWKYIGGKGKNFLLLISANKCEVYETQIEQYNKLINGNISGFK